MTARSLDLSAALVPVVVLTLGCKSSPGDAAPTAASVSGAASTAPSVAAPVAPVAPAARGGDGLCDPQPYAHRCDATCKSAHKTAIGSTCASETAAFTKAVPNPADLGRCLVGCRKPGTDSTCVGAADKEGCECQLGCYRVLPRDVLEKAKAAERCYASAIEASCR
jgi:hypothetical protein